MTASDPLIGQQLDRYRIESKLGQGGMGVVYRARDTQLDRTVALKVLPHDKVSDPARKQRFMQEAKAASALNHPAIVTVYDISADAGVDFIVMEYVRGRTLDEVIPAKGLPSAQALRYGIEMADALATAHGAGIIHRDLKPSNVLVTDDGHVKILDFGLAKLGQDEASPETETRMAPMTEPGFILGTPAYMSPEQAEGRKVDARSDIFSFGSVLYEMVTATKPFAGESRIGVLVKVVKEDPPPPSRIAATLSPDVEKIVLRCLRKDPSRRYQTMADLKIALEDVAHESSSSIGAQIRSPRRRSKAMTAAALAALLLLVVASFAWRLRVPTNTEPLRAEPLATLPGVERHPSFSPDGSEVAFSWNGPAQDNSDIYLQQIGAGSPLRLTKDPANDHSPAWSPDGRSIAFLRGPLADGGHELRLIPPLGGADRRIAEVHWRNELLRPMSLTWCADSSCVVVTDSTGDGGSDALFAVAVASGEKRQLTFPQAQSIGDTDQAVSHDGQWMVFRRNTTPTDGELYRLALRTGLAPSGEASRLPLSGLNASGQDAGYPAWTPDDRVLFAAQGGFWEVPIAGGTPTRVPFVGEDGMMPAVSRAQPGRAARLVYVRSYTDYNIWRIDTPAPGAAASSPPAVAIASTRYDGTPALSPEGRRMAFMSTRQGALELWVSDLDGSNAAPLTSMGGTPGYPRWSPDGGVIAFHSNAEGPPGVFKGPPAIYVIPASGGKPRGLRTPAAFPSFSHDGRWLYFNAPRENAWVMWKMPAAGGDVVPVADGAGQSLVESQDGAYIYYLDSYDKPSPLWRVPTSGGPAVKIVDSVIQSCFAVVRNGIYYIDRPEGAAAALMMDRAAGNTRLQYFDFATRTSKTIANNLGIVGLGLTASPDGRSIYYSRVDSAVDDLMLVENFR